MGGPYTGVGGPGLPQAGDPGGLLTAIRDGVVKTASTLADLWRVIKKPGYFFQLPPLSVRPWTRDVYANINIPGFVFNRLYPYDMYVVPDGRVLILTDVEFFLWRNVANDNPRLMDPGEYGNILMFQVLINGAAPWEAAQNFTPAPNALIAAGTIYNQRTMQGVRPQIAAYASAGASVGYGVTLVNLPDPFHPTPPDWLGVRFVGYTMSDPDYRRALTEGSHL